MSKELITLSHAFGQSATLLDNVTIAEFAEYEHDLILAVQEAFPNYKVSLYPVDVPDGGEISELAHISIKREVAPTYPRTATGSTTAYLFKCVEVEDKKHFKYQLRSIEDILSELRYEERIAEYPANLLDRDDDWDESKFDRFHEEGIL